MYFHKECKREEKRKLAEEDALRKIKIPDHVQRDHIAVIPAESRN